MSVTLTPTRTGPRNWIARKWAALNTWATLHVTESDLDYFEACGEEFPGQLRALELRAQELRCTLASLR